MLAENFKFKPSKIYIALIVIIFDLALFVVAMLSIPLVTKAFLMILTAGYGVYVFYRYGILRGKKSIVALKLQEGSWEVSTNAGVKSARLRNDSTITSVISVLRFDVTGENWPWSCIVFRDSLPADGYRQLMIAARLV